MKDSLRTLVFAAVLAVVCAGLLTAASYVLRPLQDANAKAEKWRNIFGVLDVAYDPAASAGELLKLVRSPDNPGGKVAEREAGGMNIFQYDHPEEGLLRAVEFSGPGLWGPVEGLLCLKADLKTVFRISFYKHEETPGLGGEISSEAFGKQFVGRSIDVPGAPPGIRVVRTRTGALNEVDAISGATLTCDKVAAMLDTVSKQVLAHREEVLRESGDGR